LPAQPKVRSLLAVYLFNNKKAIQEFAVLKWHLMNEKHNKPGFKQRDFACPTDKSL
jgi:hypothetical protein